MSISELITKLQELKDIHGDVDCCYEDYALYDIEDPFYEKLENYEVIVLK